MNSSLLITILIGGSGTRLWPYSRGNKPKQFLPLLGEKYSLLQNTVLRAKKILNDFKNNNQIKSNNFKILLISNIKYKFFIIEQMLEIGMIINKDYYIILEPIKKNTLAPSIIACQFAKNYNIDYTLILSSDHILNDNELSRLLQNNWQELQQENITVFGITPTIPSTNYGYIKFNKHIANDTYQVVKFIEKPNEENAKKYIQEGMLWNSGIFHIHCNTLLENAKTFESRNHELAINSLKYSINDMEFIMLAEKYFCQLTEQSIDYGVIENSDNINLIKASNLQWNDIGSWDIIQDISKKDKQNNIIIGNTIAPKVQNSMLLNNNEQQLLVCNNFNDILVYIANDIVFVSKIDDLNNIKEFIKYIETKNQNIINESNIGYRPWGKYENILIANNFKIKRITVLPSKKISLQLHHKRSEHWTIISGNANVLIDDKTFKIRQDQSIYIPINTKHRITNDSQNENLIFIEIQCGNYLEEDDIIRFDDDWGRC